MNKSRILSHLLILGSGRVTSMAISSLTMIVMTRYLGVLRVGELTLAMAIVGLLGQFNALGMETFLIRAIAREPARAGTLVSTAWIVRAFLIVPGPLILAVYIHFAQLNRETSIIAWITCLGMIIWSFSIVLVWMLQGLEQMSFVAINDVVRNVFGLVAAAVIIVLHWGVAAFAASATMGIALLMVLNGIWARPYVRLTWRVTRQDIRDVVMGSLSFWAKDVTMTFYTYIDSVILGSLAGARAVGLYGPPTRVFGFILFVPNIVGNATLPLLSRLGIDTGRDFVRVSRKSVALLILCGVPLTIGLATFAGPVIAILFGSAFHDAGPVLVIISMCIVPMFLNSQFAQILSARDRQWRWTGIMVAGSIANVVFNLISIPLAVKYWHNGALGAASALLATELLMTVYGFFILQDVVLDFFLLQTAFGIVVAGAAQVAVVLLMGSQLPLLIIGETLGIIAYVAVAIALGALPRGDFALLWQTALRRAPKRPAA